MKKKESNDLIRSILKLEKVKKEARKLGLFVDDRELLTCPKCRLQEDVTIEGLLIVVLSSRPGEDTGLRFSKADSKGIKYCCPACKTKFLAPENG